MKFTPFFMALFIIASLSLPVLAENWDNWRGPNYNGTGSAKNLPTTWSKTENVAWVTPMPGESAATPVVWGDQIFISSLDESSNELVALSVNKNNGEIEWKKTVGLDSGNWQRHNKSSPSPVTDGKSVYFLYGTGDLAAYDTKGNELWKMNLEKEYGSLHVQWGYGSSPLLYNDTLYIQVLHRDRPPRRGGGGEGGELSPSYILALNPANGEVKWRHIRETDAVAEAQESYTTPIPFEFEGRKEIIVFGGDYVTGHNPDNGEELWRWGNYNPNKIGHYRIVPTAVTGAGHVYVAGPKREPLFAVAAGKSGKLDDSAIAWKFDEFPPDVCVPVYYQDKLYVFDGDKYVMTCIDPKSGNKIWQGETGGRTVYRSSPTAADGKIYIVNEEGMIVVMEAGGTEYKELSRIEMGEGPVRSCIVPLDGQLLIRTSDNLYCIGKKE